MLKDKTDNWWSFDGEHFDMSIEDIKANGLEGFVYHIHDIIDGTKYVGMKHFWSRRTPKGKINKKKSESNWRKYTTSNTEMSAQIKECPDKSLQYAFKIECLCKDKASMKYMEAKHMMISGAMESDEYLNGNIRLHLIGNLNNLDTRVITSSKRLV